MSASTLNDDCWFLVLDQLFGDFRTLGRLLQTSRQLLTLSVPRLYTQLCHPANDIVVNKWSFKKRSRLATLIFTCSGHLNPSTDSTAFQHLYRTRISNTTFQFCQLPLTLDYFQFLSRLSRELIEGVVWSMLMEDDPHKMNHGSDDDSHSGRYGDADRRIARVLTEIYFTNEINLERWLPWTTEFAQLTKLTLNDKTEFSVLGKQKLIEFVTLHAATFPGQLVEIESGHLFLPSFLMELNVIAGSKNIRLKSRLGIRPHWVIENIGYLKNVKEFEFLGVGSVRGLRITESHRRTLVSDFNQVLKCCRQLETIRIQPCLDYRSRWAELLFWAPKEFLQRSKIEVWPEPVLEPATLPLTSFSLLSLFSQSKSFHSLVPVKNFICFDMPGSVLDNAMDGFRYTIEKIVFRGMDRDVVFSTRWTWPLSRLTFLELTNGKLVMQKLDVLCPVLEVLYLENVTCISENDIDIAGYFWNVPSGLKRLSLIRGTIFSALLKDSMGQLQRLESLYLDYWVTDQVFIDQRQSFPPNWNLLPKLKYLTLHNRANVDWQQHLLESCPSLESFASPDQAMMFSNTWWRFTDNEEEKGENEDPIQHFQTIMEVQNKLMDRCQYPESFVVCSTKVKSLWFGGGGGGGSSGEPEVDLTRNQIESLSALLSCKSEPMAINKSTKTPITTTTKDSLSTTWVLFPELAYLQLDRQSVSVWNQMPTDSSDSCPEFDKLLIVLMNRSKMRRILTKYWSPSIELVETRLETVSHQELPTFLLSTSVDPAEIVERDEKCEKYETYDNDFGCILVVEEKSGMEYYRLRKEM